MDRIAEAFDLLLRLLPVLNGDTEPMMNILCTYEARCGGYGYYPAVHTSDSILRRRDKQRLISPGAIDLSGVVPLPRKSDFERFTKEEIIDIFMQVSLTSEETNRICKEWRKI